MIPFRIGLGYDIHRFAPDRSLILGGVEIPFDYGLEGHSDADCLSHAIADAILGGVGLPDIGHYFPPGNPDIKDIDSQVILKSVYAEVKKQSYEIVNIDSMIIAELPKCAPYIGRMKEVLSATLGLETNAIGIKATTNERLGCIGRAEGIAAHATCLLARSE